MRVRHGSPHVPLPSIERVSINCMTLALSVPLGRTVSCSTVISPPVPDTKVGMIHYLINFLLIYPRRGLSIINFNNSCNSFMYSVQSQPSNLHICISNSMSFRILCFICSRANLFNSFSAPGANKI